MAFTLEYGGFTKTLAEWGIERANLTLRSLARGELVVIVRTLDADDNPIFAYKGKVILRQGTTVRFIGHCTTLPVFASERTEYHSYTFSDGWWWLEQITYRDVSGPFYAESDAEAVYPQWPYCPSFTIGLSGMVHEVGGTWTAKTIGQIIVAAVTYAGYCGAPVVCSGLFVDSYAFLEDGRDISCAKLVQRALNWSPSAVTWWDYSGETQALRCDTRTNLYGVNIELGGPVAQSWKLASRDDIKVDYAELYIIRDRRRTDGTAFRSLSIEGSAPAWPGPGCLIASVVMGTDSEGNEEEVPPNIAATLVSEMGTLQWEGEVVCVEDECSFLARPGNALNFTGSRARAAWNNMNATVQQVAFDLVTGRTVITFGPPSHLSIQDMIAILNQAKQQRPPDRPPNPGGGPGGGGGGSQKGNSKELELCDGSTIEVLLASPAST